LLQASYYIVNLLEYFQPYDEKCWILFLAATIGFVLIYTVSGISTPWDAAFYSYSIALEQGGSVSTKRIIFRIVFGLQLLTYLIITNSYRGVVTTQTQLTAPLRSGYFETIKEGLENCYEVLLKYDEMFLGSGVFREIRKGLRDIESFSRLQIPKVNQSFLPSLYAQRLEQMAYGFQIYASKFYALIDGLKNSNLTTRRYNSIIRNFYNLTFQPIIKLNYNNREVQDRFDHCYKSIFIGNEFELDEVVSEATKRNPNVEISWGKDQFEPKDAFLVFGPLEHDKSRGLYKRLRGYEQSGLITRDLGYNRTTRKSSEKDASPLDTSSTVITIFYIGAALLSIAFLGFLYEFKREIHFKVVNC